MNKDREVIIKTILLIMLIISAYYGGTVEQAIKDATASLDEVSERLDIVIAEQTLLYNAMSQIQSEVYGIDGLFEINVER